VQANALKISFAEIENFRPHALNGPVIPLSKPTWIHPYQVIVPHRDFLENYDVGDEVHVAVVDHESFQQKNVTVTVTQEMIDHHSYVHFRFALNDQT